jgi:hypothetical protein
MTNLSYLHLCLTCFPRFQKQILHCCSKDNLDAELCHHPTMQLIASIVSDVYVFLSLQVIRGNPTLGCLQLEFNAGLV